MSREEKLKYVFRHLGKFVLGGPQRFDGKDLLELWHSAMPMWYCRRCTRSPQYMVTHAQILTSSEDPAPGEGYWSLPALVWTSKQHTLTRSISDFCYHTWHVRWRR